MSGVHIGADVVLADRPNFNSVAPFRKCISPRRFGLAATSKHMRRFSQPDPIAFRQILYRRAISLSTTIKVALTQRDVSDGTDTAVVPIRFQQPIKAHVAYSGVDGRKRRGTSLQTMSPMTPPNVPVITPNRTATKGYVCLQRIFGAQNAEQRESKRIRNVEKSFEPRRDTGYHRRQSRNGKDDHRVI